MYRTDICGRTLACQRIALYTVIRLQKEKVSEHPPWKVVYSETRL